MAKSPKLPVRITHNYDDVKGDVRAVQFVYDNGAIIEKPYTDAWNTQEFDVPFAKQSKEKC